MTSVGNKLIKDANALTTTQFEDLYVPPRSRTRLPDDVCRLSTNDSTMDFLASSQLSAGVLGQCLRLIETTSRKDYETSSIGWHPKRKKREMREDDMRYLILFGTGTGDVAPVIGFLSFMLTHDSTPSVPVLYIYEIHLKIEAQGSGLGTHLMDLAESIAEEVGVDKVMLTCFVSNERARGFYRRRGYSTDACSPGDRTTRGKTIKADYVIMSKPMTTRAEDNGG